MATAGINKRGLRKELSRKLRGRLGKVLRAKTVKDVEKAKSLMLAQFDNHPVTREIKAGPQSQNTSQTLSGVGNLFSFIGFGEGDQPTDPVRRILEQSTRLIALRPVRGKIEFEVVIEIPSRSDVAAVSPIPWAAARSWVVGIEQGLSGLGQYLVKPGAGRSQGGIQIKGRIRQGGFRNTSYISGKKGILGELQRNLMKFLHS
jgi:hypothetical protein